MIGAQYFGVAGTDEKEIEARTLTMISRSLNTGQMMCVAGSGLSRNYGYPLWRKLTEDLIKETSGCLEPGREPAINDFFEDLGNRLAEPANRVSAEELMGALQVAQEVWEATTGRPFHSEVRQQLKRVVETDDHDPLRQIIRDLRIQRFCTTNYEDTIGRKLDEFVEPGTTRYVASSGQLLEFAIGAHGNRTGVFHLHGRLNEGLRQGELIVTERDYQRLYLSDEPAARAYREAVSTLFRGNPILFVGMGLTELDLLQPLREAAAQPRRDIDQAPLFALLPHPGRLGEAVGQRRQILMRYGIQAVFFPPISTEGLTSLGTRETVAAEFGQALARLSATSSEWWSAWRVKPPVHTPRFESEDENRTMLLNPSPRESGDAFFHLEDDLRKVTGKLAVHGSEGCIVLALGRAGMGKGGLGTRLVRDGVDGVEYERRFFATLHFTNDFVSIIEAAARHLDPDGDSDTPAMLRLVRALQRERHLLVLGAVERMLTPIASSRPRTRAATREVSAGRASGELAMLLEAITGSTEELRSHVVLTSALEPVLDSSSSKASPSIVSVALEGVSIDETKAIFEPLLDDDTSARHLHRVLGRHAYLLWLVAQTLGGMDSHDPDRRKRWVAQLFHRLSSVDRDRRRHETLDMVIEELVDKPRSPGRAAILTALETISLFSTPVDTATIELALQAVRKAQPAHEHAEPASLKAEHLDVSELLDMLCNAGLLLRVATTTGPSLTAHTAVRAYLLVRLGLTDMPGETHRFELSGYSAEAPITQPGSLDAHERTAVLVDALLDRAEDVGAPQIERTRALRAAFGLARSRWTATGIARLGTDRLPAASQIRSTHYGAYIRRLSRLANGARHLGKDRGWLHWDVDADQVEATVGDGGVLFVDELAWLYNELGLASYLRGSVSDAQALFRMGRGINELVERSLPPGRQRTHRWAESQINLAMVSIERGRLERAHGHLHAALGEGAVRGDEQLRGRIRGHQGLVSHLMGDYDRAEAHYQYAIKVAVRADNRRAVSLFSRHFADLCRTRRQPEVARDLIQQSIAAAESARHYDLLRYALVAEAHLDHAAAQSGVPGRSAEPADSIATLLEVQRYARRAGLAKLEQDALSVHARVVLHQGDVERAMRLSLRGLSIAAMNGLVLSLTRTMVGTAQVLIMRGEDEQARRLLRSSAEIAERQRYQLTVEAAERLLLTLGTEGRNPAPT